MTVAGPGVNSNKLSKWVVSLPIPDVVKFKDRGITPYNRKAVKK